MKLGVFYISRRELGIGVGRIAYLGVCGRSTLSGKPLGWAFRANSTHLNRALTINIDRPTIGRYHW